MGYSKESWFGARDDGVVYEFQYDDPSEVRSVIAQATSLMTSQFLQDLEDEDWDFDLVVLLTDDANANAENAAENFEGVGVRHVEWPSDQ